MKAVGIPLRATLTPWAYVNLSARLAWGHFGIDHQQYPVLMAKLFNEIFSKFTNSFSKILENLFNKKAFSLNWSFRYTLILFMIVFGYYGWGTTLGLANIFDLSNVLTSLILISSSILLYLRKEDFDSYFQKPLIIDFRILISTLSFLVFGILINHKYLFNSLTVDETAYAWFSQLQTYVITLKIAPLLPSQILEINSSYILQAISLCILLIGAIFLRLLSLIRSDLGFLIIVIGLTFVLRGGVQYVGGANGPNSPLSSFWYFTTSTLFGLHNSTYRFLSLMIFCCLSAYLYRRIKGESATSKFIALLTSLLLFSIPLVSSMSFVLEIANWTFIASVVLFVELAKNNFHIDEKILILLGISYYLRVNIITLIIAVFLCSLFAASSNLLKDKWKYIYPLSIILPGLSPVIIGRLTERLDGIRNPPLDLSINYHNSLSALINSGSSWYLVVVISSIIILLFKRASRNYILLLMVLDVVVFLGLNTPSLTISSKYIIEYFFPLVFVLGLWPMLMGFENRRVFVNGVLIVLLAVNAYGFAAKSQIPQTFSSLYNSTSGLTDSATSVIPYTPLAYKEAFQFVHKQKLQPCFNAGIVYSAFPEILEGLPLSQIMINRGIRKDFLGAQARIGEDWTTISYESIVASNIKCVILGAVGNQLGVIQELKQKNWRVLGEFPDKNYRTMVYIMSERAK